MTTRSNRHDVRNPVLGMPEVLEQWEALPPEAKAALIAMLQGFRRSFSANAATALHKHKPPIYAYWKAFSVYARHLALAGRASIKGDPK